MVMADPTLNVMSFNIRFDGGIAAPGNPDYWPEREPLVEKFLSLTRPDILGVQELMGHQIASVQRGLSSGYESFGLSRDHDVDGERCSIFYNSERLELKHWDQLWLSDTPRVVASKSWGNRIPRVVSWGLFHDRVTGREFTLANTHLDHLFTGSEFPLRNGRVDANFDHSRVKSAELINALFAGTIPAMLMGDFNSHHSGVKGHDSYPGTKVHDVLTSHFNDTFDSVDRNETPDYGTFNDYETPALDGARIDWILATPDIKVKETTTHTFNVNGRYPSDHLPISARLELTK